MNLIDETADVPSIITDAKTIDEACAELRTHIQKTHPRDRVRFATFVPDQLTGPQMEGFVERHFRFEGRGRGGYMVVVEKLTDADAPAKCP